MITLQEVEKMPYKSACRLLRDSVNRHLKHLRTTEVYIMVVHFMVDCKDCKTETEKHLYLYCDQILKELNNG